MIKTPTTPTDSNRRILVIDDNLAIHTDLKKILSGDDSGALDASRADLFGVTGAAPAPAGFVVESAYQGQEGLQRVQQALAAAQPYAMAFVDVRMPPGWDGIETLAEIWKVDPDIQAVICTAYSDYTLENILKRLGSSDRFVILKKPFDNVEVTQLANALTEKWRLLKLAQAHVKGLERDVTLRTIELRRTEARYRLIAENAADLIALVNAQGRRLYNSPSYERTLGYSVQELAAADPFEQIHPEDQDRVRAAARDAFALGASQVFEYRIQHKNGSWRTLESHSTIIRHADGDGDQLLVVSRDITERKKAEAERETELQLRQARKLESIEQTLDGVDRVAKSARAMKDPSHPGATGKTAVDLNRALEP